MSAKKSVNNNIINGCPSDDSISEVYLLNPNDCIFENYVIVRMKRKYGKFKRPVYKLTNS